MRAENECPVSKYLKYRSNTLETPLFHFVIRPCLKSPAIQSFFAGFYSLRWHLAYPLQTRIPTPKCLAKVPVLRNFVFLTIGEVILILPFIFVLLVGIYIAFRQPDVELSGMISGTPIAVAFLTANKSNSVFGFLTGIPFERMLPYHVFAGTLSIILGALHAYVAFAHLDSEDDSQFASNGNNPDFVKFSFDGDTNTSGTITLLLLLAILLTSIPRKFMFQLFYFTHVILVAATIFFSIMHEVGIVGVVAFWWGVDLFTRIVIMAGCRYPKKANIRNLPADIIELSFPKPVDFEYNAGQYVFITIPKLTYFEAHPFSISSSPHMDLVTIHIRVLGNWTAKLKKLAEQQDEVNILMEGPCGSLAIDLFEGRYKMALLISGGIGITPMQSICNALLHQNNELGKPWKKIWFVWTVREYGVFDAMKNEIEGIVHNNPTINVDDQFSMRRMNSSFTPDLLSHLGVSSKTLDSINDDNILIADFHLSKVSKENTDATNDFLSIGRPDIPNIFEKMKQIAKDSGEKRVAVCVCGPMKLVEACQTASLIYSDCGVSFDFHSEKFDF